MVDRPRRIVMLSDLECEGGAAVAASRLAQGLLEQGHEVIRLVRRATNSSPSSPQGSRIDATSSALSPKRRRVILLPLSPWGRGVDTILSPLSPWGRGVGGEGYRAWHTHVLGEEPEWRRQLLRLPRRLAPQLFPHPHSGAFAQRALDRVLRRLRPDVVNVHNLHGAAAWGWDADLVRVAAQHAPVFWTIHDLWSFTGRCAYRYDCTQHLTGCGPACPTADEAPPLAPQAIAPAWQQRRRVLAECSPLAAVAPSRWLVAEARAGLWRQRPVHHVPYGVPTETYFPIARDEARRRLGLPREGRLLLVAAVDLGERRKGAHLLAELLPKLPPGVALLTMGTGTVGSSAPGRPLFPLGYVQDEATRNLAYNAADALLHPAPVDNLPNVVLEALAAGTPTIALPIGGLPDMVRPQLTGWLADAPTAASLGAAVSQALAELDAGFDLRDTCRKTAEFEYPLDLQARRYEMLFAQREDAPAAANPRTVSVTQLPPSVELTCVEDVIR